MRLVLASVVALMGVGCAHTVTNEERLDGLTDTVVEEVDVGKLRCRDTSPEIQLARDASRKQAERVSRYQSAVAEAKSMQARFDEAFRKDPDLVYGAKGEEWKRRQAFCGELVVTLEREKARVEVEEAAPVAAPVPVVASAPDEAFEDDADQARTTYKKRSSKAKVAKASKKSKKSKKRVSIAAR